MLIAKLSTGEMAYYDVWHGGFTKNPWNLLEGASGSSAGRLLPCMFGYLLNTSPPRWAWPACPVETFPGAQAWVCSPSCSSMPDCGTQATRALVTRHLRHTGSKLVVETAPPPAAQQLLLDIRGHIPRLLWHAGSASATAAGMVPFAIGTETCGSITSPASQCGVTGLRPSFGAVGRSGVMALAPSLVCVPTLGGRCNLNPAAATSPACARARVHLACPLTVGYHRVSVQQALLGLLQVSRVRSFLAKSNRFVRSKCSDLQCVM